MEYIDGGRMGVHVCQGRYVTRIVEYAKEVDPEAFMEFVQKAIGGIGKVEKSDVRVARRYAWDLGIERDANDLVLMEAYWTQNYRRTRNDDPDRPALFLCSNKDSFFVQPLSGKETLCESCRK